MQGEEWERGGRYCVEVNGRRRKMLCGGDGKGVSGRRKKTLCGGEWLEEDIVWM